MPMCNYANLQCINSSQIPMLMQRWKILFFGISMQYVHGIFTQLAHRMHQPLEEPLHDIGFVLTPVRFQEIPLHVCACAAGLETNLPLRMGTD